MFNVNRVTLLGRVSSNTVSFNPKNKRTVFILESRKERGAHQKRHVENHVVVADPPLSQFVRTRLKEQASVYVEGQLSTVKSGESFIVADRVVLLTR